MHALKTTNLDEMRSQGAELLTAGVRYRTWCEHERVDLLLVRPDGGIVRSVEMRAEGEGYFTAVDPDGKAGDLYRYRLGQRDHFPDPASCWQPLGVHGPSMVIDHAAFKWTDETWKAPEPDDLVIYELHIGTLTPEGTFRSAIAKLDYIAALGANAIELMPIADFSGNRNWGYDGVTLYAPSRAYGHPDDLRSLVDAAHARGLAVILDVVYNHFGPDGNYVVAYHRAYWNVRAKTPWGAGHNFERKAVRNFFAENPSYWRREFHIDGFRLDATHTIHDTSEPHILREIGERVHATNGFIVVEDERNEPNLLRSTADGGLGLDGCWADDFHHIVRVRLTGEREAYYANYQGSPNELLETLRQGWLDRGQKQHTTDESRGAEIAAISPAQFIYCISNHDQVGNRAFGERLGHGISSAAYRAASALLCLVPQTPMIFMGQEWNASSPFQFFTDHTPKLGQRITEGRRGEFHHFTAFRDPATLEKIPDPQSETTFENSKLRWDEIENESHAGILSLYRECLSLRLTSAAFRNRTRESYSVQLLDDGIVAILFGKRGTYSLAVVSDLRGGHEPPDFTDPRLAPAEARTWQPMFSSNETRFGGDESPLFQTPTTLVLGTV